MFNKPADRLLDIRVAGTTVSVTPEHPFYVPGRGWVLAGDLRVGTNLLQRDGTVTAIQAIDHREEPTTVYNFEVEGDHNYYVSPAQLLVHNCDVPDLNPSQARKLNEFNRKMPNGAGETTITRGAEGEVHLSANVPGHSPGSSATYNKILDENGVTTSMWKTTYDKEGRIVHIKDKMIL